MEQYFPNWFLPTYIFLYFFCGFLVWCVIYFMVVDLYSCFDFSHRDADTDSVNTMVVHEDEGEGGEEEQAGGYGDQTMLVQRVSHSYTHKYIYTNINVYEAVTATQRITDNQ